MTANSMPERRLPDAVAVIRLGRQRIAARFIVLAMAVSALVVMPAGTAFASDNPWYDKYVAMDAAVGDDYYQTANGGDFGWGESYLMESYVNAYKLSGDTTWLDKIVTHTDQMISDADDADGDGYLGWSTARYSPLELNNDGMETADPGDSTLPRYWTRFQTNSSNAYRTSDAAVGSWGARLNSDGQLWRMMYQDMITYEPDTVYQLSAYAKTNGSAAGGQVYLRDKTANQVICRIEVTSTTYQYYSKDCRTPAAAGHDLEVWIGHLDYTVAGGVAYFDAVKISGKFPYIVHDGMIGSSIAQFIRLIDQTPALPATYQAKASSYLSFLQNHLVARWENSSYIGNTWGPLSSTTGTYKQSANFDAFHHGGGAVYLPYNMSLAFTRMLLILHDVTGDATYLDRATRNGQYFKDSLTLTGGAYTWRYSYWVGTPEDVSHANIDVSAARELYEQGLVFNATDMERFATTITNMWNGSTSSPAVRKFVNNTGDYSYSKYIVQWTEFAQWRRDLFRVAAEQYRNSSAQHGYDMLVLTKIMKWDPAKLVNQGFEGATSFDATYPAQWYRINSSSTTAFRDSANAHTGTYGLTITSTAGTAQLVRQAWEDWTTSQSYTLEFTGKTSGGAANGRVYVKNETTGAVIASKTFSGSSWASQTLTFNAPSTPGQTIHVYIGNDDPSQTGNAHVDNIRIRPTSETW